jgi:hypothetical protein
LKIKSELLSQCTSSIEAHSSEELPLAGPFDVIAISDCSEMEQFIAFVRDEFSVVDVICVVRNLLRTAVRLGFYCFESLVSTFLESFDHDYFAIQITAFRFLSEFGSIHGTHVFVVMPAAAR